MQRYTATINNNQQQPTRKTNQYVQMSTWLSIAIYIYGRSAKLQQQ